MEKCNCAAYRSSYKVLGINQKINQLLWSWEGAAHGPGAAHWHSHNDTHGVTSDELRRSEMFTDKSEQKKEQTIMEYQIGRDLKEHLVQPFLSKV